MAILNQPSVTAFHGITFRAQMIKDLSSYWVDPTKDLHLINPDALDAIERIANEIIAQVSHIRNQ
jgi:hypothetical protein